MLPLCTCFVAMLGLWRMVCCYLISGVGPLVDGVLVLVDVCCICRLRCQGGGVRRARKQR